MITLYERHIRSINHWVLIAKSAGLMPVEAEPWFVQSSTYTLTLTVREGLTFRELLIFEECECGELEVDMAEDDWHQLFRVN